MIKQLQRLQLAAIAAVFCGGAAFYTAGLLAGGSSFAGALAGGVSNSLCMFFANHNVDLVETAPWFSPPLALLFWLIHIAAVFLTAYSLLQIVAKQFTINLRILFGRYGKIYILQDATPENVLLARNIATDDGKVQADKQSLVVITDPDAGEDCRSQVASFGGYLCREAKTNPLLEAKMKKREVVEIKPVHAEELAARQAIAEHPPYECLAFDAGKANRGLHALVLGFAELGQEMALQLIRNSQFVGGRPRITVIDRRADSLKPQFKFHYPCLDMCCDIEFHNCDVTDAEYYKLLDGLQPDYVAAALGTAEKDKAALADITTSFLRRDLPLPVAISMSAYAEIDRIYTKALVVNEALDRMAMAVNGVYSNAADSAESKARWDKLDEFSKQSSRASADFIAAHLHIAGVSLEEAIECGKDAKPLPVSEELTEVLAETEHLRWNAFHFCAGFRPETVDKLLPQRKDLERRLHICLVPYAELDDLSQDYNSRAGAKRNFKNNDRAIIQNLPQFLSQTHGNSI
jgi:hypothetical protein